MRTRDRPVSWVQKMFAAAGWTMQSMTKLVKPNGPAYPVCHRDFVSDHPDIVEAFREEHQADPACIPARFCPGYRLGGSFFYYLGGHPGSDYGDVAIISRDGKQARERSYPQYRHLHLYLYPDNDDPSTLSWETVEAQLPKLVQESIRVGLELYNPRTEKHSFVLELAHQLLAKNADPEFTAFLEAAPLFGVVLDENWSLVHLTLDELRQARHIQLSESGNQISDPKEILYILDSWAMREICKRYELPFSHTKERMEPPQPDPEELLMSKAVALNFGSAGRKGELYSVSNFEGQELIIDPQKGQLCVPVRGGETVTLSLDGLEVIRKDRRIDTDTKTHEYCYIFFKQGGKSASVYERFKDYYEGGLVQADLDKSQNKARSNLNRVARDIESGDLRKLL